MSRKNKYNIKTKFNFNMILLIIIPVLFIGGTVAKYIQEKNVELVYQAKSFYFESDLLSDNTNPQAYTYERGRDDISINLSNNIDELRYSEVDIEYVVTITDRYGNQILDKEGNVVTEKAGILSNKNIDKQEISFTNLPSGIYLVTAEVISPYEKTLQASFVLTENDENIIYQVNDSVNSPVLQLTVRTQDYSGNIKISWPEGVVPDSTNPKFLNIDTGYEQGSTMVQFEANSEYVFQFFKKQLNIVFTKDNFSVERS